MVRDLGFHCQGPRFNPWLGKLRSHKLCGTAKKKKKRERESKFLNSFVSQLSHLKIGIGTSFVVQWLRLCAPIAGGMSSIPGWETRIPHATGHDLKKKNFLVKKKKQTGNNNSTHVTEVFGKTTQLSI